MRGQSQRNAFLIPQPAVQREVARGVPLHADEGIPSSVMNLDEGRVISVHREYKASSL
jgi:hypothetical protein